MLDERNTIPDTILVLSDYASSNLYEPITVKVHTDKNIYAGNPFVYTPSENNGLRLFLNFNSLNGQYELWVGGKNQRVMEAEFIGK